MNSISNNWTISFKWLTYYLVPFKDYTIQRSLKSWLKILISILSLLWYFFSRISIKLLGGLLWILIVILLLILVLISIISVSFFIHRKFICIVISGNPIIIVVDIFLLIFYTSFLLAKYLFFIIIILLIFITRELSVVIFLKINFILFLLFG